MPEFTYNFEAVTVQASGRDRDRDRDRAGRRDGREEEEDDDSVQEDEPCGKVQETWRALLGVVAIPLNDCRNRSHPRIVPDYSLLVLMACVANPVLGALACCLHRHAKHLSHKGKTFRADMVYLAVFAVSLISIGSTLLGISLLTTYHLVKNFAAVNVQRARPQGDCYFRESDDVRRKKLNMTRNDYCRLMQAHRARPELPFFNFTKVIDKTAG